LPQGRPFYRAGGSFPEFVMFPEWENVLQYESSASGIDRIFQGH
jgi:hypothetical protein